MNKENLFKIFLLMTFILAIIQRSQGQERNKYFTIGIVPTSLLDPITPSLGFSLEYQLLEIIAIEVVYGYDLNNKPFLINWHPNPEFRHHEYRMGIKYFFIASIPKKVPSAFLELEYFGVINEYEKTSDQYRENHREYTFKSAKVHRNINGIRAKYGVQSKLGKIFIEMYSGLGVRRIDIEYNPVQRIISPFPIVDEWFTPIDRNAGIRYKLDAAIGLKLSFNLVNVKA